MISANSDGPRANGRRPFFGFVMLTAIVALMSGCPTKTPTQQLDGQFKEMKMDRKATAAFQGTVTIDGKPPADAFKDGLLIMLYDPKNPPKNNAAPLKAIVDRGTGHFEFTTYTQGDGVPEGSYVVLFVALHHAIFGKNAGYHPPDALKNLYNDPAKNEQNPEFKLNVAKPGKTDYSFNLKLQGQDAGQPGEHAITHFMM
jgi:hypothetical protein